MHPKAQYHPTIRQKQGRENSSLIGIITGQHSHNLATGIGLNSPSQNIAKPQQSKIAINNIHVNFPNLEDEKSLSINLHRVHQQPSSLIQHQSNMQSSQKSIHQPASQASGQASPHNQLLGTSSSSYQFPLQALGQGLTTSQHPSKDQSRAKIMMQRNGTSSGASPLGHNA